MPPSSPSPSSPDPLADDAPVHALADPIGENLPTELYLHLLTRGRVSEQALASAGFSGENAHLALAVLEARGLIEPDASGWMATPPEQSLSSLAGQLETRAINIRAALPGLAAVHRNAVAAPGTPTHFAGTEPLSGAREVAFAYARCLNEARHEARGMRVHSMATRHATFEAMPGARGGRFNPAGRPVAVRTVIDSALVADFDVDDFADLQPAPHVHVTIATGVPFSAAVNDDGMAVIETHDAGRIDGLVLRDPGLVQTVSATIDLMLRLSAPITSRPDRASSGAAPTASGTSSGAGPRRRTTPAPNNLTDEERLILTLLTAGVPDATIARRVGVSQRTFDRRIRALMDRLNAATRFQAGVLAAQRGWL